MVNIVSFPGLGLSFSISRIAFSIGTFPVYWYGILIGIGLICGMQFAFRVGPKLGISEDRMIDVLLIGTVGGVICARAYYVLFAPFRYTSFWQVIDLRDGGLAIYGGLIGAFVFGGIACRRYNVPIFSMFDLTALGLLIGQTIGRWGNFVNQEAFGTNTAAPWGMISERTTEYLLSVQSVLAEQGITVDPYAPVHPTFLYESAWCLIGFLLLRAVLRHRHFDGEIFLLYLIWYGFGRFWIEGLRTDSLYVAGNLRMSRIVAAATVTASLFLWVLFRIRARGRPELGWAGSGVSAAQTVHGAPAAAATEEFRNQAEPVMPYGAKASGKTGDAEKPEERPDAPSHT